MTEKEYSHDPHIPRLPKEPAWLIEVRRVLCARSRPAYTALPGLYFTSDLPKEPALVTAPPKPKPEPEGSDDIPDAT
jgi:hypothetical protein